MIKKFTGKATTPLELLAETHTKMMAEHPNMYFELAELRSTGSCAWLTTEDVDDNYSRSVIAKAGGDNLVDAVAQLVDVKGDELPDLIALNERFSDLVSIYPYAYFFLYAKPNDGWVLKISTHHVSSSKDYSLLVSVVTDNVYDTLAQGLSDLKSIEEI
jgi:hypothetical protein